MNSGIVKYTQAVAAADGDASPVDYIDNNIQFLVQLAMYWATPAADHDKRALSPAKQKELLEARALASAGSALVKSDVTTAA